LLTGGPRNPTPHFNPNASSAAWPGMPSCITPAGSQEGRRIERRGHQDVLARRLVRDIAEALFDPAGDADHVARLGIEAPAVS
jgi:hypothetical protein